MHRFDVPPSPQDFATKVTAARDAVRAAVVAGTKPDFVERWGQFKDSLSAAQRRKCAFCEGFAVGQGFGDVEHYRPKSEVEALCDDPTSWGQELANLAKVKGRKTVPVSERGYWHAAYAWDNYLLACAICNQQWKKAIFPVQETPRPNAWQEPIAETPLLLHPFVGPHPKEHLEFGRDGRVTARNGSAHGFETIRTCGLDRPSLREQRMGRADALHREIDELSNIAGAELDRALKRIYAEGGEDRAHCGMVRAIYEQRTGTTWDELAQLVNLP